MKAIILFVSVHIKFWTKHLSQPQVFKETDEIRSKQGEEEEEMEEIATNAAKAPSSDSITVC